MRRGANNALTDEDIVAGEHINCVIEEGSVPELTMHEIPERSWLRIHIPMREVIGLSETCVACPVMA